MAVSVDNGIPVADGVPAVKIFVSAEEKIGLPNYSNVSVSASLSRFVPEGTDEELKKALRETAAIVEEFVAEERATVLASLK